MLAKTGRQFEPPPGEETHRIEVFQMRLSESYHIVENNLGRAGAFTRKTIIPALKSAVRKAAEVGDIVYLNVEERVVQLSLRAAQYLVEHPEAIMGCLFGFAFFSPDYVCLLYTSPSPRDS